MSKRTGSATLLVILFLAASYGSVSSSLAAEASDADILAVIQRGMGESVAAVKSGKGTIKVHRWILKNDGQLLELDTSYDFAFSGEKFKYSAKEVYLANDPNAGDDVTLLVAPGTEIQKSVTWDGQKLVVLQPNYETNEANAVIADLKSSSGNSEYVRYKSDLKISGHGLSNAPKAESGSILNAESPRIIGRDTIAGDECIILESIATVKEPGQSPFISTRHLWINPAKGYTIPRLRNWLEGGTYKDRFVNLEVDTEVREYSPGIWAPVTITSKQYTTDNETGLRKKTIEYVRAFDSSFQLNVPVSESELAISLPSGTLVRDEIIGADYTAP